MIYDHTNVACGTTVYDVDTKKVIKRVMSIDIDRNVVTCSGDPVEVTASGDIATFGISYRSIYPIRGGRLLPSLFHCYGMAK